MLKIITICLSVVIFSAQAEVPKSKIVDLTLEIEERIGDSSKKVLAKIKTELGKPFSYADHDLEYYGEYVLNEEDGKMVLNSRPRQLINGEYIGEAHIKTLLGEKGSIESSRKDGRPVSFTVTALETKTN
jgi:3-dehydroquinate synthase class II